MATQVLTSAPLSETRTDDAELSALRTALQAEHARLAVNLRIGYDQLETIRELSGGAEVDSLLLGYKALIAIVESENFIAMPEQRLPIVIDQISTRLLRLDRMLHKAQAHPRPTGALLH